MVDDAFSIAKEITLAVLPRVATSPNGEPEKVGEEVGKPFKTVLQQVVQGMQNPDPKI